jgi:hypothetical protein
VVAAVVVIITCILIALMELPKLVKEKSLKEISVFSLFLLMGAILSILLALRVELPNPIDWLMVIFVPIGNLVDRLLM